MIYRQEERVGKIESNKYYEGTVEEICELIYEMGVIANYHASMPPGGGGDDDDVEIPGELPVEEEEETPPTIH